MRKGEDKMNEYEIYIEDINSCGGNRHSKTEIIEVETESPEAYVKEKVFNNIRFHNFDRLMYLTRFSPQTMIFPNRKTGQYLFD